MSPALDMSPLFDGGLKRGQHPLSCIVGDEIKTMEYFKNMCASQTSVFYKEVFDFNINTGMTVFNALVISGCDILECVNIANRSLILENFQADPEDIVKIYSCPFTVLPQTGDLTTKGYIDIYLFWGLSIIEGKGLLYTPNPIRLGEQQSKTEMTALAETVKDFFAQPGPHHSAAVLSMLGKNMYTGKSINVGMVLALGRNISKIRQIIRSNYQTNSPNPEHVTIRKKIASSIFSMYLEARKIYVRATSGANSRRRIREYIFAQTWYSIALGFSRQASGNSRLLSGDILPSTVGVNVLHRRGLSALFVVDMLSMTRTTDTHIRQNNGITNNEFQPIKKKICNILGTHYITRRKSGFSKLAMETKSCICPTMELNNSRIEYDFSKPEYIFEDISFQTPRFQTTCTIEENSDIFVCTEEVANTKKQAKHNASEKC